MRRGPGDHIRAMRITDMILPAAKVAEADTLEIRKEKRDHLRNVGHAYDTHVCEFGEPGTCEDCPRMPRGKAGQSIPERVQQARARRRAQINGAGEEK